MKGNNIKETKMFTLWLMGILGYFAMSCNKNQAMTTNPATAINYQQINLVADLPGLNAAFVDSNLVNPWGISISPTGIFWISDNHTGVTTVYNNGGETILNPVAI